MDRAAPVFTLAVSDVIMFGEMLAHMRVLASFIGHDVRATAHMRLDDRQQIGSGGSFNVERARTRPRDGAQSRS